MLSTIFRGVRLYDGLGSPPRTVDLATHGERVALVGRLEDRDAYEAVDAAGLALAPGFIDAHSHTDERWLVEPYAESKLRQGVTTEIGGNCGASPAPLLRAELREERARALRSIGIEPQWQTIDEFSSLVEHERPAVNVGLLVGLGTIRANVAGYDPLPLPHERVEQGARLVRGAIEAGALGVSSGLEQPPGSLCASAELVAWAKAAAASGGALYATHLRSEGEGLLAALDEALEIGRSAGVTVQISHHKACGKRHWGRVHETLAAIDRARTGGEPIFADAYPYVAGWGELARVLPADARAGGMEATLERLRDPLQRAGIALAIELAWSGRWHEILVSEAGSERNEELTGKRMDEIAAEWGMRPAAAALRLLVEEALAPQAIFFDEASQSDVDAVFSAGFVAIASAAPALGVHGADHGLPHPRAFGAFPRAVGRYSRRRKIYELAEGVRRATSLPAAIFGLRDRGTIAEGTFADLVLFEESALLDRATYEQPRLAPDGIRAVYVNGRCALRNGVLTGERAGRALRR